MKVGYVRVANATGGTENLDRQIFELKQFGCEKIYTDIGSGIQLNRPGYTRMILEIQEGDTVVVSGLSRLSRNIEEIKEIVKQLSENGFGFISIKENISTLEGKDTFLFGI